MKSKLTTLVLVASTALVGCGNESKEIKITNDSEDQQKVGYTVGYAMSENFKSQFANIDLDAFAQGFKDSYNDKESVLTEEQMEAVMEAYGKQRQEEMKKEYDDMLVKNKADGEAYLKENGVKEGVVTTDSGLQYKVISEGDGEQPSIDSLVTVHYEGKLLNGDVFDSSIEKGEKPVDFLLKHMIKGWQEGIPLMKKGAKYEFVIPSDLAYGESGNMGIEPNSTLIFTVELIDVKEAPKQ